MIAEHLVPSTLLVNKLPDEEFIAIKYDPSCEYRETFKKDIIIDQTDLNYLMCEVNNYFPKKEILYLDNVSLFDKDKNILKDKYYIEVAFKNNGYCIYNKETNSFSLFSYSAPSPFHNYLNKQKAMSKEGNYYYIEKSNIYNISDKQMSSNDSLNFSDNLLYDDQIDFSKFYLIDNYEYYTNLIQGNFGNNYKGSCAFIALQLFVGYFDTYYTDHLVPEQYDSLLDENTLTSSNQAESFYRKMIEDYFNTSFFDENIDSFGILNTEALLLVQSYFETRKNQTNISNYSLSLSNNESENQSNHAFELLKKSIIENKRPAYSCGSVDGKGHSYVTFGLSHDNKYLLIHTGWQSRPIIGIYLDNPNVPEDEKNHFYDCVILNSLIDSTNKQSHYCSNNYHGKCLGNHKNLYCEYIYSYLNKTTHLKTCIFHGEIIYEHHGINCPYCGGGIL